jgi:hypothetical protein
MHTPAETPVTNDASLGATAKTVAEHASALARLEVELAQLEVKKKVGAIGLGVGLAVGAGVLALYGFGFLFATIAAAFETFLPTWLSLLIVTLLLLIVAGILGVLAKSSIRKGTPPVPEQAIREAKLTQDALKR